MISAIWKIHEFDMKMESALQISEFAKMWKQFMNVLVFQEGLSIFSQWGSWTK